MRGKRQAEALKEGGPRATAGGRRVIQSCLIRAIYSRWKAAVPLALVCGIMLLVSGSLAAEDSFVSGFDFDDGTTEGWTLGHAMVYPSEVPLPSNFSNGWSDQSNYPDRPESSTIGDDRGSLQLYTEGGHGIEGPSEGYWVMAFASPGLSGSDVWQRATGFTVRIANCMGRIGVGVYVNLHYFARDQDSGRIRHFANGSAVPLPYGVWSLQAHDWSGLPTNVTTERLEVHIWGHMARGEELKGGIYLDDVMPIMPAAQLYIDDDGGGSSEDGSWEQPFDTIQEAVDRASDGDSILIKDGVYTGEGNWSIDFRGKAVTVQSLNGPANCIVRCAADQGRFLPAFTFHSSETDETILRGLTITGSRGASAIVCRGGSPTIANCILHHNRAATGGGMYCENGSPRIRNCVFISNTGDRGGALYAEQSTLVAAHCTFARNEATMGGGGIHLTQGEVEVSNCILWRNTAPIGPQLFLTDSSSAAVSYSALGEGTPGDCFCGPGSVLHRAAGNMTGDPLFETDDYHLQGDSPCIDRGEPNGRYWDLTDIDEVSRLFNARVDIGADEVSPKIQNLTQGTYEDTIQEAIDQAVNGDTVVVPSGIYTGKGNRNIYFRGKAVTVRSSDGPMHCIIDCRAVADKEYFCGFKFVHGEDGRSVLDGFTVRNGYGLAGGAIFISWSSPSIRNCRFVRNSAVDEGGGIAASEGDAQITNCLFLSNSCWEGGAGLSIFKGDMKVTNCTFLYNIARSKESVGGALQCSEGNTEISNSLLWNNLACGGLGNEIAMRNRTNKPTGLYISHSNVAGGTDGVHVDSECQLNWGAGNTDVDPVLTPDGHLRSGSPCINTGTPTGAPGMDWEKESRSVGEGVDIGCDEYVDCDEDQLPDYWEEQFFGSQTGALPRDDADGDMISNLQECTLFGSNPIRPPYYVDCLAGSDNYDGRAAQHMSGARGPKKTIQAGIDAADDGDTILVAAGTYVGAGNVNVNTKAKSIVVYAPAGPESTIVDCDGLAQGFTFASGETPSTVVSGFTIRRGQADTGGAMACSLSHPHIRDCRLTDSNATSRGGGLYCASSVPILDGCRIEHNRPDGIQTRSGGVYILGTNQIEGNSWIGEGAILAGPGALELQPDVILDLRDCRIRCDIHGPGALRVNLGCDLVIEGDAAIDLAGADAKGKIHCDGMLHVKDRAQIHNAHVVVSRASFEGDVYISNSVITAEVGAPYGQFFIEDTVTISDNEIHADGDRYMDLDPSVFAGVIANNRIYVTITEGRTTARGGLLELRGRDMFCPAGASCEPGIFSLPAVPDFDPTTWTIERLELLPGSKVSLTNRFDFGNGDLSEAMYVKDLVLGDGCVLNTAFNRLYYEHLEDRGSTVVNVPLLGFSLSTISFDDQDEFTARVVHNNHIDQERPHLSRVHVERVVDPVLDPNGMVRMQNLKDHDPESPTYHEVVHARVKGLFAKSNEDRILVTFEYLFETDQPGTELVVYLSDVSRLQDPRDPHHHVEVGRLRPPRLGRPGSVGSERFGVFHRYVRRGELDFVRGTRMELHLAGPENARVLINNWDPQVHCHMKCMDLDMSWTVTYWDLLPIIAQCGRAAELGADGTGNECVDGVISCDGYADALDVTAAEWAVGWTSEIGYEGQKNLCPDGRREERGLDLASNGANMRSCSSCGSLQTTDLTLTAASLDAAFHQEPLLILGKPHWDGRSISSMKYKMPYEHMYVAGQDLWCAGGQELTPNHCVARLVRGSDGQLYQINVKEGVLELRDGGPGEVVLAPGAHYLIGPDQERRYHQPADVYVGLYGSASEPLGRPVWDVAVEGPYYIYVVPVVVVPASTAVQPYTKAYLAAAKLEREGGIVEIYDDAEFYNPEVPDNPYLRGLREIEVGSEGDVYVLNAHRRNASDILWKYDVDGGIRRIEVGDPNRPRELSDLSRITDSNRPLYIPGPVGLCVSNRWKMVYVASGQIDPSEPDVSRVYGFSTENLSLVRQIEIAGMDVVTGMAEDPSTGTLWVAGFVLDDLTELSSWDNVAWSFYYARVASVGLTEEHGQATWIEGNHDLALPLSIVWTGTSQ